MPFRGSSVVVDNKEAADAPDGAMSVDAWKSAICRITLMIACRRGWVLDVLLSHAVNAERTASALVTS